MYFVFMNIYTGEILTSSQAKKQFIEEYDGDDPTNANDFFDYYKRIDPIKIDN